MIGKSSPRTVPRHGLARGMVWRIATNRYMLREHGSRDADGRDCSHQPMPLAQNNVNSMEQNNIHIWNKIGMVASGIGEFDDQETRKSQIYK